MASNITVKTSCFKIRECIKQSEIISLILSFYCALSYRLFSLLDISFICFIIFAIESLEYVFKRAPQNLEILY